VIARLVLRNLNTKALSITESDTHVSDIDVSRAKNEQPEGYFYLDARETPINKVIQAIWTRLKMFGLHRANRTFSGLEILQ
jgi:hypothetical protein